MKQKSLEDFEKKLGIRFADRNLLQQVFVHRSYLNEHRSFALDHNERLEFLGDAVLELVVTEYLYVHYDKPEGELTNWRSALVRGEMLSKIAKHLSMEAHLLLSRGEQKGTGKARQLILANTFEAFVGALYLDQGYGAVKTFITEVLICHLEEILASGLHIDAKSDLQEKSQEKLSITPNYVVLDARGPDHAKEFEVAVYIGEQLLAKGTGGSKQKAEQDAATKALEAWNDL